MLWMQFIIFRPKHFSASAGFDNTNLTPYLKIAGEAELNGSITGKIEVNGNAAVTGSDKRVGRIFLGLRFFQETTRLLRASDSRFFKGW